MKKVLSAVLIICLLLSLCGCSQKAYESKAAEFSSNGITITLTKAFEEKNNDGYTVCYDSEDSAVFILKESYSLKPEFKDMTLEKYAESIYEKNSGKNPTPITQNDGLTYIEYEFSNGEGGASFKYFVAMYKGVDAFWLVQFVCDVDIYSEYFPHFVKWAKTVNVSVKTAEDGDYQREQI